MNRVIKFLYSWLPIIAILCLGAYLRLYKIDQYMTFLGDEGRDVIIVRDMIIGHKWTLLGPTASVGGFFMGPIYYYFMLPFLWAWKLNPVGPAIMVALFGIATIYLIYHIVSEMFSKRAGLFASLFYALSPVVISYSRSSWNPNIVPFFAILLVYFLWRTVLDNKPYLLFAAGLCAGIGVQLHYTFLFLLVFAAAWILLFFRSRKYFTTYAAGIAGFIVGFSPFLAFELRHGFSNSRAIWSFVFAGKDTGFQISHFITNISDVYFRLFGRLLLRIPEAGVLGNITSSVRNIWIAATWFVGTVSVVSLITDIVNRRKPKKNNERSAYILLFLWFIIPLFFFGLYKKSVYDYYFGIFFPLPFLLLSLVIDGIMKRGKWAYTAGILIVFSCALYLWQGRPFLYEPNNQLKQVRDIAREIVNKTDNKPYNFALITGGNSDHAYRYFFELWGQPPVTIENVQNDPFRKTVTDQLLIVCEDISCQPLGNSLWEVAGFGRAEIVEKWDVSVVTLYKLGHYIESPKP